MYTPSHSHSATGLNYSPLACMHDCIKLVNTNQQNVQQNETKREKRADTLTAAKMAAMCVCVHILNSSEHENDFKENVKYAQGNCEWSERDGNENKNKNYDKKQQITIDNR